MSRRAIVTAAVVALAAVVGAVVWFASRPARKTPQSAEFPIMGTLCRVTVYEESQLPVAYAVAKMEFDRINAVCSLRFKTLFPRMTKSEVNGPNELPLYTYLKSEKGFVDFDPEHPITPILVKIFDESGADWRSSSDIKWNFTKFLIDKEGNVVERFEPTASLDKVEKAVVSLL